MITPFYVLSKLPKIDPSKKFFSFGEWKSQRDRDQVNRGPGEPQECILRSKILLWKKQLS